MKIVPVVIFTSFICINFLSGQTNKFSITARTNFLQTQAYQTTYQYQSNFASPLNSQQWLEQLVNVSVTNKREYEPKLGFEVFGLFTIRISNKIALRTGLGLNYTSLNIMGGAIDSEFDVIRQDTVPAREFTSSCNVYENSISDLGEIKRGVDLSIFNLIVPIGLQYQFINNKINLEIGAVLQTPLISNAKSEAFRIEREESPNGNKCTFVKIKRNDGSGNSLQNSQIGGMVNVHYSILNNIRLELGVRQMFSSQFVKEEWQTFPITRDLLRPLILSIGINYGFEKSN